MFLIIVFKNFFILAHIIPQINYTTMTLQKPRIAQRVTVFNKTLFCIVFKNISFSHTLQKSTIAG